MLPLKERQISHVVTLDTAKPCLPSSIAHLFIAITDEEISNLLDELPKVVTFVQACLDSGSSALIHCRHGVSRSAAAVAAVLMSCRGYSMEEALARVVEKKALACPNTGFKKQLMLWEKMGNRLDQNSGSYAHFLLQSGVVRLHQAENSCETALAIRYKCKKCRRQVASSHNVLPHLIGNFPCWFSSSPTSQLCPTGLFLTPMVRYYFWSMNIEHCPMNRHKLKFQDWMEKSSLLSQCSRLLCPGCGAKLGSLGDGVGCPCGSLGGRGALILISRVDATKVPFNVSSLVGASNNPRQCAQAIHADSAGGR